METVLALDVSSFSTGWAFLKVQTQKLLDYGLIQPKSKFVGRRLQSFKNNLEELIYSKEPTYIVCESLNYARNIKTVITLGAFLGVVRLLVYLYNKSDVFIVTATQAKNCLLGEGKGRAEKEEVLKHVNKRFSLKLSATKKENFDISDSVAVGVAFIEGETWKKKAKSR